MTKRKSYDNILKEVLLEFEKGNTSINGISKEIKSNWATTKRAIKTLQWFGLIHIKEKKIELEYSLSKNGNDIAILRKLQGKTNKVKK